MHLVFIIFSFWVFFEWLLFFRNPFPVVSPVLVGSLAVSISKVASFCSMSGCCFINYRPVMLLFREVLVVVVVAGHFRVQS